MLPISMLMISIDIDQVLEYPTHPGGSTPPPDPGKNKITPPLQPGGLDVRDPHSI